MKKNRKKDVVFHIFFGATTFLSVYMFALLRRLSGEPGIKLQADLLAIVLLLALNTAVYILHEKNKLLRRDEDAEQENTEA